MIIETLRIGPNKDLVFHMSFKTSIEPAMVIGSLLDQGPTAEKVAARIHACKEGELDLLGIQAADFCFLYGILTNESNPLLQSFGKSLGKVISNILNPHS